MPLCFLLCEHDLGGIRGLIVLTVVASFAIEASADPFLMQLFPLALPDAAVLAGNLPTELFMVAYTMFSIGVGF